MRIPFALGASNPQPLNSSIPRSPFLLGLGRHPHGCLGLTGVQTAFDSSTVPQ